MLRPSLAEMEGLVGDAAVTRWEASHKEEDFEAAKAALEVLSGTPHRHDLAVLLIKDERYGEAMSVLSLLDDTTPWQFYSRWKSYCGHNGQRRHVRRSPNFVARMCQ